MTERPRSRGQKGRRLVAGLAAWLAAGLAGAAAGSVGVELAGSVYTEGSAEAVVVRAWARGDALVASPGLLAAPLAETTVAPGAAFRLSLPQGAALPVEVEASAAGHGAVCLLLLYPVQTALPPAWLPRGQRLELTVHRRGKAAPAAVSGGQALDIFQEQPPLGRFYPCIPRGTAPSGQREVWVPAQTVLDLWARDEDGAWARWRGRSGRTARATLSLESVPATVRVTDRQGQPVAGARVAAGEAPPGAAAVTDGEGRARVQVHTRGQWSLTALAPGVGARTVRRGPPPEGEIELELGPVEEVELRWSGPRGEVAVLTNWLAPALTGGAPALAGGGRTRVPLLGALGAFGSLGRQLVLWAPGFEVQRVAVDDGAEAVEVDLKPAASLAVRVVDGGGRGRAGVPVWAWIPEELPVGLPLRLPFEQPPARRLLPEGVTDGSGAALLGGLPAGKVRASARAAGFPEARSEPMEVEGGQRREVTLTLARGVSLVCTVVDSGEAPLEGALVEVYRRPEAREGFRFSLGSRGKSPADAVGSAVTDGDGRAVVGNLAPGPVSVWVTAPGFAARQVEAEVKESGGEVGPVVLTPGVTVRGRVVDETGAGVPSANIFSGSSGAPMLREPRAQSDGEGYFLIPDLPADQPLLLQARADRYVASLPTRVPMPPPELVELKVLRGRTLAGRVVDEASAGPVAGAQVAASQREQRSFAGASMMGLGRVFAGGETDEQGSFLLEGLPPGENISLFASAAGYQHQQLDIDLAERDERTPVTITLQRGLVLAGQVVDASGAPRSGVMVEATSAAMSQGMGPGGYLPPTVTSAEGRFRFEGVPAGQWQLAARDDAGGSAREVVEAGRRDVVLRLAVPGGVRGRVVSEEGAPVGGAEIRVISGQEFKQATADGTGVFQVPGLAPGSARVAAQARGWVPDSVQVTVESGRTAEVTLKLKRGGVIVGRVLGLTAEELGRCRVGTLTTTASPDAGGAFRLEGVATGSQLVRAMVMPDMKLRQTTVEVPAVGAEVEVELDFGAGLTLSGRVRRGGRPVAGVSVTAGPPRGPGASSTVTDQSGAWSIAGLPEGELQVGVVSEQGALVLQRQLTLSRDTTLDLEIPDGSLAGRVVAGLRREGVAGATVRLEHEGKQLRSLTTDETGAFSARELPDGSYRLRASAPGWSPAEAEGAVTMGVGRPVTLELKEEEALLLRLREPDGSVPDRVNLLPARGGRVEDPVWAACDREGRLRVTTLPRGEYLLLVQGRGQALVRVTVPSVETSLALAPAGTLVLALAGGVTGAWRARVVAPELGAVVPANPVLSPGRDGWVNVEGRTPLRLPAGRYLVEWVSPRGETGSAPAEVPREGSVTVVLGQ